MYWFLFQEKISFLVCEHLVCMNFVHHHHPLVYVVSSFLHAQILLPLLCARDFYSCVSFLNCKRELWNVWNLIRREYTTSSWFLLFQQQFIITTYKFIPFIIQGVSKYLVNYLWIFSSLELSTQLIC